MPTSTTRRHPAPIAGPSSQSQAHRRHPDQGDHRTRATVASVARISGVGAPGVDHVRSAPGHSSRAARRGRSSAGGRRSLLDPRLRRSDRLRNAVGGDQDGTRRIADRRDARLFRKAAHDGGLEGSYQRPAARRQLPHQRGPAAGAAHPARNQRARPAGWNGIPGHDHAPIHRRPDRVGRHRRAHDGKPGAPAACLGPVVPGRFQERHQRRRAHCRRRHQGRLRPAPLPVRHQGRPLGHRAHGGQRGLPHHPARRQVDQLRRRERGRDLQRTRARRTRRAGDDRLLAREQPEAASSDRSTSRAMSRPR